MSTPLQRDAIVTRALLARRLVSARAIEHAKAVQRRGYSHTPIGELLVELGHLAVEDLLATLADVAHAPVWDGHGFDTGLLAKALPKVDPTGARALPIRVDDGVLLYASADPLDEGLVAPLRRAVGAKRAVVRTTDVGTLARLVPSRPLSVYVADAEIDPRVEAVDEAAMRARWTPDARGRVADADGVEVRLVNALLLEWACAPGSAIRVEAFDEPAIRCADGGGFDGAVPLPASASRALLERCIWRLKAMAWVPVGPDPAEGHVYVRTPTMERGFHCAFVLTERGLVATLRRDVPWAGHEAPYEPRWARWRKRFNEATSASAEDRPADAAAGWRSALHEAEQLGDEAILERITTLGELSRCLDAAGRAAEALGPAEQGLALAEAHELGPRCAADSLFIVAAAEEQDLARRVAMFARAAALVSAPGIGRSWAVFALINLTIAERCLGWHTEARDAAERAYRDDVHWFGATTLGGVRALVESALASAALGDAEGAERSAQEAVRVGACLEHPTQESDWALGSACAAAGRHDDAAVLLERASTALGSNGPDDLPFIELALARSYDRLRRGPDAVVVARRAFARPMTGLHRLARAELETIARRAPYR